MTQIKTCCESIVRSGFGILQMSDAMLQDYKKLLMDIQQSLRPLKIYFPLFKRCYIFTARNHQFK